MKRRNIIIMSSGTNKGVVLLIAFFIVAFTIAVTLISKSCSGSSSSSSGSSFTNSYGTSTTKCAHKGCNNYIASSGNTNCCETHSHKCLECGKYIDEDAMYCMSCLKKALK